MFSISENKDDFKLLTSMSWPTNETLQLYVFGFLWIFMLSYAIM